MAKKTQNTKKKTKLEIALDQLEVLREQNRKDREALYNVLHRINSGLPIKDTLHMQFLLGEQHALEHAISEVESVFHGWRD